MYVTDPDGGPRPRTGERNALGGKVTYQYDGYEAAPAREISRPVPFATGRYLYRHVFKRALDLALVAIAALPVLMVVMPLAAILLVTGGSPFFVQERVGRDGRIFRMWKLRSMVPDAEARLAAHLATDSAAHAEWDAFQKLNADPRITRFGRFLRKTSLDELPQLWNVLRGEMSIVGPRPMLPDQQDRYPGTEYYALRPGLTGPWQVSSRNASSFADRAIFDRQYFHDLSLTTDLALILRTFRVLLTATGR